jgi:hypothetical protein
MFNAFFIASLLFFSIFCFFEIVVFNEEILLALCFFSFLFFCFNAIGNSIFESFQSRASKFEEELLSSFNLSMQALVSKFSYYLKSRTYVSKLNVFSVCINHFLDISVSYVSFNAFSSLYTFSIAKLSELATIKNKTVLLFQQNSFLTILYPLIFKKSKGVASFLTVSSSNNLFLSKKTTILTCLTK